jgi:hypothetical protein
VVNSVCTIPTDVKYKLSYMYIMYVNFCRFCKPALALASLGVMASGF